MTVGDKVLVPTCCKARHGTIANIEGEVARIHLDNGDFRWVRLEQLKEDK